MRPARIVLPVLAGVLCASAFLAPAGAAAHRAGGFQLCLSSGTTCLRDANNSDNLGNSIVEGSGIDGPAENIVLSQVSAGVVRIDFTGHTNLSADSDPGIAGKKVFTSQSSGEAGVNWTMVPNGSGKFYLSNVAQTNGGTPYYLEATNITGHQLIVAHKPATVPPGEFFSWTLRQN